MFRLGGGGGRGSDFSGTVGGGANGTNGGSGGGGAGRIRINRLDGAGDYALEFSPTMDSGLATVGAVVFE